MQSDEETVPISWWSWRPGIKPRNALVFGGLLSFLGLLLIGTGLLTLTLGILDGYSPPLQVPGVVTGHTMDTLNGLPHLTIRSSKAGFPANVSPTVSQATFHAIHNGDPVLLDYSPRLHFLYALDHTGQRYTFPGTSQFGNPPGSLALLFLGLLILPYPALLTLWGWRDLHIRGERRCTLMARVVNLRSTRQAQRIHRPGLTPRVAGSWQGVALRSTDSTSSDEIITFSVAQEVYQSLHKGSMVEIIFSPNLRYVYSIEERAG